MFKDTMVEITGHQTPEILSRIKSDLPLPEPQAQIMDFHLSRLRYVGKTI